MKTVITYTDITDCKVINLIEPEFIIDVKRYEPDSRYETKGQIKLTTTRYTPTLDSVHQIKRKVIIGGPLTDGPFGDRDILVAVWKSEIYLGSESELY